MYGSEADYTGLGALHPNDPNTIYISTHVDPRNDVDITYCEICGEPCRKKICKRCELVGN